MSAPGSRRLVKEAPRRRRSCYHEPMIPTRPSGLAGSWSRYFAIPLLAVGLVCSLLAMSPISYPGAIPMVLGAMTSSASTLFVWALTLLAVRRMTVRTIRALMAEWRSGGRLH